MRILQRITRILFSINQNTPAHQFLLLGITLDAGPRVSTLHGRSMIWVSDVLSQHHLRISSTTTASTKVKAPGKSSTVAEAEEVQRGIIASMAEPLFQVELPPGIFDPTTAEVQVNQGNDPNAMDTTNVPIPDLLSDFDILAWAPPAHRRGKSTSPKPSPRVGELSARSPVNNCKRMREENVAQEEEHQEIIRALQDQVNQSASNSNLMETKMMNMGREIAALKASLKTCAQNATKLIVMESEKRHELQRKYDETARLLKIGRAHV